MLIEHQFGNIEVDEKFLGDRQINLLVTGERV